MTVAWLQIRIAAHIFFRGLIGLELCSSMAPVKKKTIKALYARLKMGDVVFKCLNQKHSNKKNELKIGDELHSYTSCCKST